MINDLIDRKALFVVNHSGGKDSQAMFIKLLELVPVEQLLVVHASLGEVEWEGALEHARDQAAAAGVPFIVATAIKTFFEMVEHRFKVRPGPNSPCWPSAANRQCTSDLKRGPIEREIRRYAKERGLTLIVTCTGIRGQESAKRAKASTFHLNERNSVAGRTWYEWAPIHTMKTDEVFATIAAAGQKPHPAYAAGNERLSCVFCIMGSRNDIRKGAIARPELFARYVEIEQRTGYTMHMSRKSLTEIIEDAKPMTRDNDDLRDWSRRALEAAEDTVQRMVDRGELHLLRRLADIKAALANDPPEYDIDHRDRRW